MLPVQITEIDGSVYLEIQPGVGAPISAVGPDKWQAQFNLLGEVNKETDRLQRRLLALNSVHSQIVSTLPKPTRQEDRVAVQWVHIPNSAGIAEAELVCMFTRGTVAHTYGAHWYLYDVFNHEALLREGKCSTPLAAVNTAARDHYWDRLEFV